jgi:hemerythrin-like domain-containing protein
MMDEQRRRMLASLAGAGGLYLVGTIACAASAAAKGGKKPDADKDKDEDEVSPTEDLMREHGILRRVLGVYDEVARSVAAGKPVPVDAVAAAATIVREFIEDYHEKDEEEFLFPRLEKAGKLADLVATLRQQHQAGRRLTDGVLRLATPAGMRASGAPRELAELLEKFDRMYRAHAAREDTVLFPAFRKVAGAKELDRLRDVFEQREKAVRGGDFDKRVAQVAALEKSLGIDDLARYTPT